MCARAHACIRVCACVKRKGELESERSKFQFDSMLDIPKE